MTGRLVTVVQAAQANAMITSAARSRRRNLGILPTPLIRARYPSIGPKPRYGNRRSAEGIAGGETVYSAGIENAAFARQPAVAGCAVIDVPGPVRKTGGCRRGPATWPARHRRGIAASPTASPSAP